MYKAFKAYVLGSQIVATFLIFGIGGALLGRYLDADKAQNLEALFAGIGLAVALFSNIFFIIKYLKTEDIKASKKNKNGVNDETSI